MASSVGTVDVYHTDGLGSVRALTDASAQITQTYATDEFGVPTDSTGPKRQPFQYTGEERDENGLVFLRARTHVPDNVRFLQRDPLAKCGPGIGGWNRYSYVGNNPVSFADPTGLRTYFISGVEGSLSQDEKSFMTEYQARTGDPTVAAATYSGDKLTNLRDAFLNSVSPDRDAYASKLAQRVLKDRTNGIIPSGEEINFIGVSGGETIAFNAAEILRRSFVTINNVAFIGGYVQRGVPGNVSNWIVVVSRWIR